MPHRLRLLLIAAAILAAASMGAAQPASAQGFLHRIKKAVKEKTKEHVDQHINQAAEAGVSKVDQTIVCVVTDLDCIHKAQAAGTPVSVTDASGKKVSTADSAAALQAASSSAPATAAAKPGTGAWVNYDFVPGDTPIFVDDFGADNVGDFPRRLTFKKGNMEVAEWNGARWMRVTSDRSEFAIPLPETLPDRFTLEFDYAGGNTGGSDFVQVHFAADSQYLAFAPPATMGSSAGIVDPSNGAIAVTEIKAPPGPGTVRHASIMVDGAYAKVYVGSQRVSNVPNATLGRPKSISFEFLFVSPEKPGFIGNIRVAAGGKDLYSTLSTKGRVATHGILFDVGSATIRPESTPTLKEIGQMLEQHADLKLSIEGHTDNTGSAASNQKLSDERAAAVKTYLVTTYHIDASRLTTKGYGDTKPVASNDTPEGRQQNRRVELVKM